MHPHCKKFRHAPGLQLTLSMRHNFISVCAQISSNSDMLTTKNILNTAYMEMILSSQSMFAALSAITLTSRLQLLEKKSYFMLTCQHIKIAKVQLVLNLNSDLITELFCSRLFKFCNFGLFVWKTFGFLHKCVLH